MKKVTIALLSTLLMVGLETGTLNAMINPLSRSREGEEKMQEQAKENLDDLYSSLLKLVPQKNKNKFSNYIVQFETAAIQFHKITQRLQQRNRLDRANRETRR